MADQGVNAVAACGRAQKGWSMSGARSTVPDPGRELLTAAAARSAARQPVPVRGARASAAGVLALLYCGGGAALLLLAHSPIDARAPVGMLQVIGSLDFAIGIALVIGRLHAGPRAIAAGLAVRIITIDVLAASAMDFAGLALTGFSVVALALFVGCFFDKLAARSFMAILIAGFLAASLVTGVPGALMAWLSASAVAVGAGEVPARLIARLRRQASVDELTGLANRAWFYDAAGRAIAFAARYRAPLTLVLLDLDDFKLVNDSQGHLAGDALLAELARVWQGQLRDSDLLARLGGDEFALLLPGTTTTETDELLERLRRAHQAPWSAGVAGWSAGCQLDDLLRQADRRLYQVKGSLTLA